MGKLIRLQPQLLKLILHGNQYIKQKSIITFKKNNSYHNTTLFQLLNSL